MHFTFPISEENVSPKYGGVNKVFYLVSVIVFQTPFNFNFLFCFVAEGM